MICKVATQDFTWEERLIGNEYPNVWVQRTVESSDSTVARENTIWHLNLFELVVI